MKKGALIFLLLLFCSSGALFAEDSKALLPPPTSEWNKAAKSGNLAILKDLIAESGLQSKNVLHKDTEGNTPLMYAASSGNRKAVELLLNNGAEVYKTNSKGFSALHVAVYHGDPQIVKLLIDHGAKPRDLSDLYPDILFTAIRDSTSDTSPKKPESVIKTISILAANGLSLNTIHKGNGNTLLILAASLDNLPVTRFLIEEGADVKQATKYGYTALLGATHNQNPKTVKLLIEGGADIYKKGPREESALEAAFYMDDSKTLEVMLSKGIDPGIGSKLLMQASQRGKRELVRVLLSKGLKLNTKDVFNSSIFIEACKTGKKEAVLELLKRRY